MNQNNNVLLHAFTITHVLDCLADPTKNRVIAEFSDNIAAVFPYLNAVIPNLMYNPAANIITIKREWRILTFYPHVAVMAKIAGAEDAVAQLTWFQELCNETWRRRAEIAPCYEPRKLLGPLDVYPLLPRLNCKACGEATCMAFAFELLLGGRHLSECPHLQEPEYAVGGRRLAELLSIAANRWEQQRNEP
jgi:ArsR family metal-binding transcriptional regulator